jgi:predicted urease superfamily metal-dependent hydrolase
MMAAFTGKSANPPDDARLVQVVLGHLHFHPVAGGEADESFPHFARDGGQNLMFIVQFHLEHRSRKNRKDSPFHFDVFFHEKIFSPEKERAAPGADAALRVLI